MQVKHLKRGWFALVRQNVDLIRSRILFQTKSKEEAIRASRSYWWEFRVAVITWMGGRGNRRPEIVFTMNQFAEEMKDIRKVRRGQKQAARLKNRKKHVYA